MGKFFLAGGFLGVAVTWAIMHFLLAKGLDDPEVQKALKDEYTRGRSEATSDADAKWQKAMDAKVAELDGAHKEKTAKLQETADTLKAENRRFRIQVESAQEDAEFAIQAKDKAREALAEAQAKITSRSTASKELLVKVTKLKALKLQIHREFAEVCTVVTQALVGWPDADLARSVAKGIVKLASRHRRLAQDVQVYIDQNSKELSQELGKDLGPYRAGVQEKNIDAVDVLAAKVADAASTMKKDIVVVEARNEEWTDTEVFVDPGDVIQVRAAGSWRVNLSLPTSGPHGWGEASQYKLHREAPAGSLILKIGISERVHRAFLGKPIPADAKGRVMFRMNDKDPRDNGGSVKVEVISSNPKRLRETVRLWKAFKKL